MTICSDGHEEIVFSGKRCPLCDANQEIEDLKEEIDYLEKQSEE